MSQGLLWRRLILVFAALMVVGLLAACGSGDDEDGGTTSQPVASVPTPAPVQFPDANLTSPATPAPASDPAPSSSSDAMMDKEGPKTTRVVLGLVPPSALTNAPRYMGSTSAFQLKPMYEYLMDTHPETRAAHSRPRQELDRGAERRWPPVLPGRGRTPSTTLTATTLA